MELFITMVWKQVLWNWYHHHTGRSVFPSYQAIHEILPRELHRNPSFRITAIYQWQQFEWIGRAGNANWKKYEIHWFNDKIFAVVPFYRAQIVVKIPIVTWLWMLPQRNPENPSVLLHQAYNKVAFEQAYAWCNLSVPKLWTIVVNALKADLCKTKPAKKKKKKNCIIT